MSRYRFEPAVEADDAALRARMASDWLRGDLSVSFRREPSYFAGCALQGEQVQVLAPPELVQAVRSRLAAAAARYGSGI